MLEKVIFERIMILLGKHDILYDNQYIFSENNSTYTNLHETMDRVTDALICEKNTDIGVFFDLSKAFDTLTIVYYHVNCTIMI